VSFRIALLGHDDGAPAADLADALRAAGHEVTVVDAGSRATRAADALLARRGFAVPLAHVPLAARALAAGAFDIAHAFTPADAAAALLWRRRSGGPVVFTATEPPDRAGLADSRLRLRLWDAATTDVAAVTAATEASCAALWRWFALEVPVIEPSDAAAHERLYRSLLS
jgi:nucleoside-diphosphate-sugar epimerase